MDESRNIWGTPKSDINPEEYCQDCEREVPLHYDNCPTKAHTPTRRHSPK